MNGNGRNMVTQDEQAAMGPPLQTEVPRPGLLATIWGRRWLVLAAVFLSLGAGLVYLTQATPIYESTSRLYVEKEGPIPDVPRGMTQPKNYLYTQCELLKSTPVLAAALEQLGEMKTFAGIDNPVGYMKKVLTAEVGKKDDLISVSFESPYPEEAARIVNRVVEAYVTYQGKRKRSTVAEVRKILQKELAKLYGELDAKLKEMLEFKKENRAMSFGGDQGNVIVQRLIKLSDALTTAELDTIDARAALDAAKAVMLMDDPAKARQFVEAQRVGTVDIDIYDEDARLRERLRAARERLIEITRSYAEAHTVWQAARANVARLVSEVAKQDKKFVEAYVAAVEMRYLMASKREEQLASSFREQEGLAHEANIKAAKYTMLQSDLKRTERACDILYDRIKEIIDIEDPGALNITILEVAKAAKDPSKPQKTRTMAMALVLGLMLGGGLALLRDWMDHRLRSAEEVSATLGTPVLGVVPHMGGKRATVSERGRRVDTDPKSHVAESYRTIRTAIYFGVPDGDARKLLVTSPGPGDGKTTLASNLGIAMAQAGQRTLVLDADFRRPMQHEIFQVEDGEGLSNVLAGRASIEQVVRRTEIENLEVLPCGPVPPNPSEMLNSKSFSELLETLSARYDHILIDSPPVMPVADARILGANCDQTLLVLRAESTTRKAAQQAREGLLSVGARILGAVVNDVPRRKGRYGYGYYGYYGYGGKSRKKESEDKDAETVAQVAGDRE